MSDKISKWPPVFIMLSAVSGIFLGYYPPAKHFAHYFITPFLIVMLFGVFLGIPWAEIKKSFTNYRFTLSAVLINFVWTPILAYFLGMFMLSGRPDIWLGFIMLLVTPCTDWYLTFTNLSKGNVALGASILPLNLILQLLLLPFYILVLGGSIVTLKMGTLIWGVIIILAAPLLGAFLARLLFGDRDFFNKKISPNLDGFSQMFLNLAVVAMFASQGPLIINNPGIILEILRPLMMFFIITFVFSFFIGGALKFPYPDKAALNMTTLARNSPLSLAIVVAVFPDKPMAALVLVIGPLIELPVLAVAAQVLLFLKPAYPDK